MSGKIIVCLVLGLVATIFVATGCSGDESRGGVNKFGFPDPIQIIERRKEIPSYSWYEKEFWQPQLEKKMRELKEKHPTMNHMIHRMEMDVYGSFTGPMSHTHLYDIDGKQRYVVDSVQCGEITNMGQEGWMDSVFGGDFERKGDTVTFFHKDCPRKV